MTQPSDSASATDKTDETGRPASLDWTERLIGMDTTSRDSNLELIGVVDEFLRGHGIEPWLVHNDEGTKANLFATIPAADGTSTGGVVLSGHTDVVPVDGQQWSSDPFEAQVRDGRLYGRGSADMKSFIGAVLTRVPELMTTPLREPVHLAFTYDEEVGCLGAARLVQELERRQIAPRVCFVGEPSSMRVIAEHKSVNVFRATFTGVAAHSSLTAQGANAIHAAAEFIDWYAAMVNDWKNNGPFDDAYTVPYSTGGVNLVQGGIASNTVPDRCVIEFEFRTIAALDAGEVTERVRAKLEEVDSQLREQNPAAGVEFDVVGQVPGLATQEGSAAIELGVVLGGERSDEKVTYGTEAGQFHSIGIATVVCGPGDIAQAHAADEWIDLQQITACERFLGRLVEELRVEAE